jgi:hypothetical protein
MLSSLLPHPRRGVEGYLCRQPNYAVRLLMLRTGSLVIALTAMVTGPSMTGQAADTTLTLACQGTATVPTIGMEHPKPEPISMGIIVNFTNGTVRGFESIPGFSRWFNFPVKITSTNEVAVHFHGSDQTGSARATSITGSINRVTGDVEADTEGVINLRYSLKCTPTQRMF